MVAAHVTILVVEDDTAMRTMLREALEEDGYVVEAAAGGRAGHRTGARRAASIWSSPT